MTDSWEEKTERLEREYQARIDRLRAELREARDIAGVVAPDGTRRGWFGDPRDVIEQLRFENAALKKRVAELERCMQEVGLLAFMRDATPGDITAHMTRVMDSYVQRIADLQSQLAWTPVSAGLPTEPGVYEVLWNGNEITGPFTPYELGSFAEPMRALWTNYRRIELPKDGET